MNRAEALELRKRLDSKLAPFPLPVALHLRRNLVGAMFAVSFAVLPYFLLQWPNFEWLFVLQGGQYASVAPWLEDIWKFVVKFAENLLLAEIRILGWLVLPGIFVWYSTWLDLATDGKLESTRARELEHLDHEADAAEGAICRINQPLEETRRFANTLRTLALKKRLVRQVLTIRKHDLGWACQWPWFVASAMMIVAWIAASVEFAGAKEIDSFYMGSLFFGGLLIYATTLYKGSRGWRMQVHWSIIGYYRYAVSNAGASAEGAF